MFFMLDDRNVENESNVYNGVIIPIILVCSGQNKYCNVDKILSIIIAIKKSNNKYIK